MERVVKRPVLWICLISLAVVVVGVAYQQGRLPYIRPSAQAPPPGQPQDHEAPPLDVPSAITAILVCSYAIDRVMKGLLFLLGLLPGWKKNFPDPASLPDPDSLSEQTAKAHAREERDQAETNQKLLYLGPAFAFGALLATFTGVRILHVLGFPAKTPVDEIADILLTALVLMGGADQTAQVLRMLGAKNLPKVETGSRPIEIHGKLVLEDPRSAKTEAHDHLAKPAAHAEE